MRRLPRAPLARARAQISLISGHEHSKSSRQLACDSFINAPSWAGSSVEPALADWRRAQNWYTLAASLN